MLKFKKNSRRKFKKKSTYLLSKLIAINHYVIPSLLSRKKTQKGMLNNKRLLLPKYISKLFFWLMEQTFYF